MPRSLDSEDEKDASKKGPDLERIRAVWSQRKWLALLVPAAPVAA
jgi:hypothetical protein